MPTVHTQTHVVNETLYLGIFSAFSDHISLLAVSATLDALRSHLPNGHLLLPGHSLLIALADVAARTVHIFRESKVGHFDHILLVNPTATG